MEKITALMSAGKNALFIVGTSIVVIACMYKSISSVLNGDAKGCVKTVIEYIIAYVVFVLIPTIFITIQEVLS